MMKINNSNGIQKHDIKGRLYNMMMILNEYCTPTVYETIFNHITGHYMIIEDFLDVIEEYWNGIKDNVKKPIEIYSESLHIRLREVSKTKRNINCRQIFVERSSKKKNLKKSLDKVNMNFSNPEMAMQNNVGSSKKKNFEVEEEFDFLNTGVVYEGIGEELGEYSDVKLNQKNDEVVEDIFTIPKENDNNNNFQSDNFNKF